MLLSAMKANQTDIAKWLIELIPPNFLNVHETFADSPETLRYQCYKISLARDNKFLAEFFQSNTFIPKGLAGAKMLKQLAEAAAEGSNSRMARKFHKEFDSAVARSGGEPDDPPNLKAAASRGGHLSVALEFCAIFNSPTPVEISDIFLVSAPLFDAIRALLGVPVRVRLILRCRVG